MGRAGEREKGSMEIIHFANQADYRTDVAVGWSGQWYFDTDQARTYTWRRALLFRKLYGGERGFLPVDGHG